MVDDTNPDLKKLRDEIAAAAAGEIWDKSRIGREKVIADALDQYIRALFPESVELFKDRDRIDYIEKYGFRLECEMRVREDGSTYDLWRPVDFERDDPEWMTLREALDVVYKNAALVQAVNKASDEVFRNTKRPDQPEVVDE